MPSSTPKDDAVGEVMRLFAESPATFEQAKAMTEDEYLTWIAEHFTATRSVDEARQVALAVTDLLP